MTSGLPRSDPQDSSLVGRNRVIVPSNASAGGHPHRERLGDIATSFGMALAAPRVTEAREEHRHGASRHLHPYTGGDDHDTWTSTHLLPAAGPGYPGSHDLRARRSRGLGADRRLGQ